MDIYYSINSLNIDFIVDLKKFGYNASYHDYVASGYRNRARKFDSVNTGLHISEGWIYEINAIGSFYVIPSRGLREW